MSGMILKDVIQRLEALDPNMIIERGFGEPHTDRGYYNDLAFDPAENVSVRSMLANAKSALGQTFCGYKGGEYIMDEFTECFIGEFGDCGEPITNLTFEYWTLTHSFKTHTESMVIIGGQCFACSPALALKLRDLTDVVAGLDRLMSVHTDKTEIDN